MFLFKTQKPKIDIDYSSTYKIQISIEDFIQLDPEQSIRYEQYIRCLRSRAKGMMLKNMKNGFFSLEELIMSGKFDIFGNVIPSAMKELRLRCKLNY